MSHEHHAHTHELIRWRQIVGTCTLQEYASDYRALTTLMALMCLSTFWAASWRTLQVVSDMFKRSSSIHFVGASHSTLHTCACI